MDTKAPMIHESRYKFRTLSTGFEISGEDRSPVQIHLDGPKITVLDLHNKIETSFGLYSVHKILTQTASILMKNWTPPKDNYKAIEKTRENCKFMVTDKIKKWAKTKTSKALGKRFAASWRDLLKSADPTHLAAQKAIFAATQTENSAAMQPQFYNENNKYIISDIIQYRAAAISSIYLHSDFSGWSFESNYSRNCDNGWIFNSGSYGVSVDCWRKLYSPNGESYKALNKTLMKLPGGIPIGMLQRLSRFKLERPLTTRLELLCALETQQHQRAHLDVIFRSSRDDIKRALWRYAEHMRIKPKFRKTQDILSALGYILDFPERHSGNIHGLALKSISWHREARFNQVNDYGYKNETKTALPPIAFPANPHIRFLSTVGDLIDESERMKTCVRTYSKKAVMGQSFLFHVEYNEEHATVEVDPAGHVVQAKAEHNKQNGATKYAIRELTKWGKKFPGSNKKVLALPNGEVEDEAWALPF